MKNLTTIKFSLNERQFVQLSKNFYDGKFYVSAFFRVIGTFDEIDFDNYEKAKKFYDKITE